MRTLRHLSVAAACLMLLAACGAACIVNPGVTA